MDAILNPIKGFIEKTNYVYLVELIVIAAVVVLLLFVFYQLGLLKKEK
jgi:hypothetical protein